MDISGLLSLGPLPFLQAGPWNLGGITVHSFGLMVAIGVLSAHWTSVRRGEKLYGMDGDALRSLGLYMLVIGFAMSHILNVLMYEPAAVWANPKELLNITGSLSSYGGVIGAVMGWLIWRWRNPGRPVRPLKSSTN